MPPLLLILAFLAAILLFWLAFRPGRGWFDRWLRMRTMTMRVLIEDALKHICQAETGGETPNLASVAGALGVSSDRAEGIVEEMERRELVLHKGHHLTLTVSGRSQALHVIRAHRIWERHLADTTGFGESEWHEMAHQQEHELTPEEVERLAASMGFPTVDPHGDPIPTPDGQNVEETGQLLTDLEAPAVARITHIEDEPSAVYEQLLAEGLYPGLAIHLVEITPSRVVFWANGEEHILAPTLAANLSVEKVEPWSLSKADDAGRHTLDSLLPGSRARVLALSPRCHGVERRRLMDLGIIPGTVIEAEMASPMNDPTAYRVRDTLIALRKDQARNIQVEPAESSA